ncbi:MAG: hypothetical protein EOO38_00765 [Cytophagaceae bacterium]|nr:MAG: hypothetical protein EOO38_00765 [Cytophagaceae bacterium]
MKSETHQDRSGLWLDALAITAIVTVLYVIKDPAVPSQAAEQFLEQCSQPVASPFKKNFACVHGRANQR